jgi:DNA-binding GntR family transcriptional regulator
VRCVRQDGADPQIRLPIKTNLAYRLAFGALLGIPYTQRWQSVRRRSGENDANGGLVPEITAFPRLKIEPLHVSAGLRGRACEAIKRAITEMDIYGRPGDIRLEERQLSRDLGISRTPVREALSVLEQEGFVRTLPRRGIYVVRKTRRQVIEMIVVWAAIESLAARFAAERASEADLRRLRHLFDEIGDNPSAHLSEYSQANMAFHRAIIGMGGCNLMSELTDSLFIHMRAVRAVTMGQDNRAERSIVDHMNIIAALESHDADLSERLVREHTLGLADHVEKHGAFLDHLQGPMEEANGRGRKATVQSQRN